jgi:multidrug transporter EmrE-like cation transporter
MTRTLALIAVLVAIVCQVYTQVTLKFQVARANGSVVEAMSGIAYFLELLTNPWVISAVAVSFVGMLAWLLALTKLELSFAYPLVAFTFPTIVLSSHWIFGELVSPARWTGVFLIVLGVALVARS